MEKKTKQNLIYAGAGILVIAGIGYYFYRQGKKQTTQAQLPPNDNPKEPETNTPSGASTAELTAIAAGLYGDMKGFNITGHNPAPYQSAVALSDYDFVKMYNIFNAKYQALEGETLTQMFDGETYIFLGDTGGSVYMAFKNKLNKLNLK